MAVAAEPCGSGVATSLRRDEGEEIFVFPGQERAVPREARPEAMQRRRQHIAHALQKQRELVERRDAGLCRHDVAAAERGSLELLVEHKRAAGVGDEHRTERLGAGCRVGALASRRPLGQQDDRVLLAFLPRFNRHGGATDADCGDRGVHLHLFRVIGRNLTGDEDEDALEQRDSGLALECRRVEDHLVEHNARVLADRERALVDEEERKRCAFAGLDDVALEDWRVLAEHDLGAVDAGCCGLAVEVHDPADAGGSLAIGQLCVLARRARPCEARRERSAYFRASFGVEIDALGAREELADDDRVCARPVDEHEVVALARVVSLKQERAIGHDHRAIVPGLKHERWRRRLIRPQILTSGN